MTVKNSLIQIENKNLNAIADGLISECKPTVHVKFRYISSWNGRQFNFSGKKEEENTISMGGWRWDK